ncbi:MAG: DNA mismatch repair protein MutL, partial [Oscillatoriales cyanobacterium SM2_1_8]|nr:DNA mismatch repair protein MutL [Oscillatoriales cyanobacterium SM2_1_8]
RRGLFAGCGQWQQRLTERSPKPGGPYPCPTPSAAPGRRNNCLYRPRPANVRAIAQVRNTYILAEHPGGIWLVEQHVADERALFEALTDLWQVAPLLEPFPLDHLPAPAAATLGQWGLELEPFGPHTYLVRSLPQVLHHRGDRVEILRELSGAEDWPTMQATLACRCAVRNGVPLDLATLQSILDRWQNCRHRHTCPHGRPICLNLEDGTLARFFRRNWLVNAQHRPNGNSNQKG